MIKITTDRNLENVSWRCLLHKWHGIQAQNT